MGLQTMMDAAGAPYVLTMQEISLRSLCGDGCFNPLTAQWATVSQPPPGPSPRPNQAESGQVRLLQPANHPHPHPHTHTLITIGVALITSSVEVLLSYYQCCYHTINTIGVGNIIFIL